MSDCTSRTYMHPRGCVQNLKDKLTQILGQDKYCKDEVLRGKRGLLYGPDGKGFIVSENEEGNRIKTPNFFRAITPGQVVMVQDAAGTWHGLYADPDIDGKSILTNEAGEMRFESIGENRLTWNASDLLAPNCSFDLAAFERCEGNLTRKLRVVSIDSLISSITEHVTTTTLSTLPKGYLSGCILSNGVDTTNDINVGAGVARDSSNTRNMSLVATSGKQLDAAWAPGINAGMRDTGSIANGTWFIYVIVPDGSIDTGDILASLSPIAPTMPSGYTYFRRIGCIIRSGGAIIPFVQDGDYFSLQTKVAETVSGGVIGTAAVLQVMSVPVGIRVRVRFSAFIFKTGTALFVLITDPSTVDQTPSTSLFTLKGSSATDGVNAQTLEVFCNTSAQVRLKSVAATTTLTLMTSGWADFRGKDGDV